MHKILIVDDEKEFLNLLDSILQEEGYATVLAENGEEALRQLKEHGPFSLIITDYKMPVMMGILFLQAAKEYFPNTPRIIITALRDPKMMTDSINKAEVFHFLSKPIDVDHFLSVVKSGIERFESVLEKEKRDRERDGLVKKIIQALEQDPSGHRSVSESHEVEPRGLEDGGEIMVDMYEMLSALSTALDIINPSLNDHHKLVCFIATSLAEELRLPTRDVSSIFMASIMHDIGAIALSDRFKLLEFEEKSPHGHAELGALLLESFPPFSVFAPLVRYHHVSWNHGEGRTLNGNPVPRLSNLIYLADRIAVLIKRDMDIFSQVRNIEEKIHSQSGIRFVPEYVASFLRLSGHEAFWLDAVSKSLNDILRIKSQLPQVSLGLQGLERLARFFSSIVDSRSHFTANHSSGVSACAEELAKLMGMTASQCREMKIAGYLHDLGKLAVSDEILEKAGALNHEERSLMRAHTYHTYSILRNIKGLETISEWASFHHETLSGGGYPFHLKAEGLPLGSRILAVADIFTALTEDRPYRKGMGRKEVEEILSKMTEEQKIDESVVSVLVQHFDRFTEVRDEAQSRQHKELSKFWDRRKEKSEVGKSDS